MTDEQILKELKDIQNVLGINASLLEGVIEALDDRLSVQEWACGGGGEVDWESDESEDE